MLKKIILKDGKIAECSDESANIFIYIDPDKYDLTNLITKDKIDEHNLNSALDPDELGRLEFEEDHLVIILKRPKNYSSEDNLVFRITSIGCFIFKDKMIIIMPEDIQILEGRHSKKLYTFHDVLIRLIYGTISHYLGHLKVINMISESLEEKMESSMENKHIINMFGLEKSLVYYLNSINSNSVLFEKLKMNSFKIGFTRENIETLDDIMIENNQCYKQAEIFSNILSGVMTVNASVVGNNLNIIIHRLTMITTIFMPLSVIAGIGGMSEWTMMTGQENWPISYVIFTLGLGIVGFLTYHLLKKISFTKKDKIYIAKPKKREKNKNHKFQRRKNHK